MTVSTARLCGSRINSQSEVSDRKGREYDDQKIREKLRGMHLHLKSYNTTPSEKDGTEFCSPQIDLIAKTGKNVGVLITLRRT